MLIFRVVILDMKEIEKGVGGVRIVPKEWLLAELSVHEDNCIALLEKVFRRGGTPST
jgi:hypothetical protein